MLAIKTQHSTDKQNSLLNANIYTLSRAHTLRKMLNSYQFCFYYFFQHNMSEGSMAKHYYEWVDYKLFVLKKFPHKENHFKTNHRFVWRKQTTTTKCKNWIKRWTGRLCQSTFPICHIFSFAVNTAAAFHLHEMEKRRARDTTAPPSTCHMNLKLLVVVGVTI